MLVSPAQLIPHAERHGQLNERQPSTTPSPFCLGLRDEEEEEKKRRCNGLCALSAALGELGLSESGCCCFVAWRNRTLSCLAGDGNGELPRGPPAEGLSEPLEGRMGSQAVRLLLEISRLIKVFKGDRAPARMTAIVHLFFAFMCSVYFSSTQQSLHF